MKTRVSFITIGLLLGVFGSEGCAFKHSPSDDDALLSAQDGSLAAFAVRWDGISEPIALGTSDFVRRDRKTWAREAPISLPAIVPDPVAINITLHQDAQSLPRLSVQASSISGEGVKPHQLGVSALAVTATDAGAVIQFNLLGLPLLLARDKEQRVFLTLKLTQDNQTVTILRLLLVTPPSLLTELSRNSHAETLPMNLASQSLSLKLVERVTFRNDSWAPMGVTLPFTIKGKVVAIFDQFSIEEQPQANPHMKVHVQKTTATSEEQETDLYVIPAIPGIEESWPKISSDGTRRVVVLPGGQLEVGLYAPMQASAYLAQRRPQAPEHLSASVDAIARCPNTVTTTIPASVNGDEGRGYCEMLNAPGHYNYSDEGIQACTDSIRLMRVCLNSGWAKDPCNAAALADDKVDQTRSPHPDNHKPWPSWMGCRRYEEVDGRTNYIYEGWSWDEIDAVFLYGLRWHSAHLETLEQESIDGILRFDQDSPASNAEGRLVPLFSKSIELIDF